MLGRGRGVLFSLLLYGKTAQRNAHAGTTPFYPRAVLIPVPVPIPVPQVLYKDAVYAALAVGAYELYDYVDWGAWLTGSLLQVRQCCSTRTAVQCWPVQ